MTIIQAFRRQAEVAAALRLEHWLKGAYIPKPPSDSGVDLAQMRDNWEQVLLSVEDTLLIALFTDDWADFDELIASLRSTKTVEDLEDERKHHEAMTNLDAAFDLAFGE